MLPRINQSAAMRRDDICLYVSPSSRARLEALITDRNTPAKVVWRAKIVLAGRRARHQRDHAADGQVEAVRVALAGALCREGR